MELRVLEELQNKPCIYMIKNINKNIIYIGQTINAETRFKQHKRKLIANKHSNSHLNNCYIKNIEHDFIFLVIEYIVDISLLTTTEQFYLDKYKLPNGRIDSNKCYNHKSCADSNKGFKHSEEYKINSSKSRIGKFAGKNNPMFDKKHTEQTKKKMK